ADDGKLEPRLAETVSRSRDAKVVTVRLRRGLKFHDGSSVTSELVAQMLGPALQEGPLSLGPAFKDIDSIRAVNDSEIQLILKRPTPFAEEALEVAIVAWFGLDVRTGSSGLAYR